MDNRIIAKAIQARRIENGPHFEVLCCLSETSAEIEQIKADIIKAHPLHDCTFFVICSEEYVNG